MKKMRLGLMAFFIIMINFSLTAQTGTVRGTLTDGKTGETIPFANIMITESGSGVSTDLDGLYSAHLPVGVYTFIVSYIGYADLKISEIIVKENEVNLLDMQLLEDSKVLEEVVVTARAFRNTETALMTIQRKAPGLLDGVSTQSIKRSGDGDVGSAIKRVTGVSVESGKHVVVRGLGDRYSKTILNNLDIPGLDPDKNSVQLDIFPTNLIDNIIVYKSFTPDLPGDFTGGMINIETKDFPEAQTFNISVGASINPEMNLNDNYITYKGSPTDKYGFDDGTRSLPIRVNTDIPERTENDPYLTQLTTSFNPIMSTMREKSGVNTSYSLSYGNQINTTSFDLGYTFSANYKNEYEYYNNAEFGTYFKDLNDNTVFEMFNDRSDQGHLGSNNVLWSSLLGVALKTQKHKISISGLHSQNGETRAAMINSTRKEFGQAILEKHNLEYTERSVTNVSIKGNHSLGNDNLELSWQYAPTLSNMTEPDIRFTAYEINPQSGAYELNPSTAGIPSRTYRNLDELTNAGRIDLIYKWDMANGVKHKIKFGTSGVYKDRDFSIYDYNFALYKRGTFSLTGDPNELFLDENIWSLENDKGLYIKGAFEPSKTYQAQQRILAAYIMNETNISDRWKAIYGLRVEKSDNWYTGRKQFIADPQTDLFEDRKVLDELDFLPSLGLVHILKDYDGKTMNLRGSFSRTLARPSFKEKSIAQIADRISGRLFIGNIALEEVKIINTDIRWEYFLPRGQMVSLSGFYKYFTNPIELTAFDATAPNSFTPRNVGDAQLLGLEFEFRNNFSFISPSLSPLSISANATLVKSTVNMTENEYVGRLIAQRDGEVISKNRVMVGQSPYVINAGITYYDNVSGFEFTAIYNVQGKRLAIVGISNVPNVYENPFHSFNLQSSFRFGESRKLKVSAGVKNLLNASNTKLYESFNAQTQVFENFDRGRTFTASVSFRFI